MINYDKSSEVILISSKSVSYAIGIKPGLPPMHLYWGPVLSDASGLWAAQPTQRMHVSFEGEPQMLPYEYPVHGSGDYRTPAARALNPDGNSVTQLTFVDCEIKPGKPEIPGLPSVYAESDAEAETLVLHMKDALTSLRIDLIYTVFPEYDAICRSAHYINEGKLALELQTAASASVDVFGTDYDILHLPGTWSREREVCRVPVSHAAYTIDSKRGASSHQHNPFIALLAKDANEFTGDVYGFSLVYSGSFAATAEANGFDVTRVSIGVNPYSFRWQLQPGDEFYTPEAVLAYSPDGINGMSQIYHKLYRQRLCRGKYRDALRPILINNWEATYFGFNEEKILEIAHAGKALGIEMFVLDDGWFGKRDIDNCSLGDWVVDKKKLPNGMKSLAEQINALGMKFGLWFEPEMVSPDSDLYRAHPDWCIHVPNRERTLARQQLILDLSRADVCDYIVGAVSAVLESAPISYVKWDMNRNMTEIGSELLPAAQQGEVEHRYMLGLYSVLERITSRFPDVLFESCSGGGGRFDPGMLYYMPQTWTSDDTDAVERLKIQYGTSIVYPVSAMGAHVSAVPNHQTRRTTPMSFRCDVAMSGNFGFELDLSTLSDEDTETARKAVELCKSLRATLQQGVFTRLQSPFEGAITAWQFTSDAEAILCAFKVLSRPYQPFERVKLRGLLPDAHYVDPEGVVYTGAALMHNGYQLPPSGDFSSRIIRFARKD